MAYNDNAGTPQTVDNISLNLDYGGPAGAPNGGANLTPFENLTVSSGDIGFSAGFGVVLDDAFQIALGRDRTISGSGPDVTLSANPGSPDTLFVLGMDIAPGTADGDYSIVLTGTASFTNDGVTVSGIPEFNPGVVSVAGAAAVPEPGSMLTLAGAFVVGGVRHWRRRRRGSAEVVAA
ncbi:hypothetical protein [Rhodopirellula baltica]|uniref:hypothetical protein n=1 Tax=Rhodopirellula baltica TaxID=265606 RepID=UPI00135F16B2|nr:hypothetical protein [Rhodopirellula baltica]